MCEEGIIYPLRDKQCREKAMATHSSTLAWQIPWMEEPGGLQCMGSLGVGTTERLHFHFSLSCIGEGHGNPLQQLYLDTLGLSWHCKFLYLSLFSQNRKTLWFITIWLCLSTFKLILFPNHLKNRGGYKTKALKKSFC